MPNIEEEIHLYALNLDSGTLSMILEYLKHHNYNPTRVEKGCLSKTSLGKLVEDEWDLEFIYGISEENLVKLMLGCQKLDLRDLLTLAYLRVASSLAGKDTGQLSQEYQVLLSKDSHYEETLKLSNEWILEEHNKYGN